MHISTLAWASAIQRAVAKAGGGGKALSGGGKGSGDIWQMACADPGSQQTQLSELRLVLVLHRTQLSPRLKVPPNFHQAA